MFPRGPASSHVVQVREQRATRKLIDRSRLPTSVDRHDVLLSPTEPSGLRRDRRSCPRKFILFSCGFDPERDAAARPGTDLL